MRRLAAALNGRLIALAQSAHAFARSLAATPFQSVPSATPPQNMLLALSCGSDLKKNNLAQGKFNPSLPRTSTLSLLSSLVVESSLIPAQQTVP